VTTLSVLEPDELITEQVTSPGFGASLEFTKKSVGDFKCTSMDKRD